MGHQSGNRREPVSKHRPAEPGSPGRSQCAARTGKERAARTGKALLALVRSEVTSSSGGAQHSVGAGQGNSAPESGVGQSTGHDGSTSSSQGLWLITFVDDNKK